MALAESLRPVAEIGISDAKPNDLEDIRSRRALRKINSEPFVRSDRDAFHSYSVEKLYRKPRYRAHASVFAAAARTHSPGRESQRLPFSELFFAALPTIAYSLSVVAILLAIVVVRDQKFAYLVPVVLAILGFAVLGFVSGHLRSLMRQRLRQ